MYITSSELRIAMNNNYAKLKVCTSPFGRPIFPVSLSEQLDITWLTIGAIVVFFECALVQNLQAERTGEVLRVELLAHRTDATFLYRLLACLTHLVLGHVVMVLAEWLTVVLKVVPFWKGHMTLLQ